MPLTRRSFAVIVATSAVFRPAGACPDTCETLAYQAAELDFLSSPWAEVMKERIGCLIDHADNDTARRVRLLNQVGVGANSTTAWAIGGQEAAATIGGVRLARLVVQHGLASDAEARRRAARVLKLWRLAGPELLSSVSQAPRWRFVRHPGQQRGGRWLLSEPSLRG
jgi:hypothetical protein